MASKPAVTPRWAQTTGGVQSNIVAPNSGKQDVGWVPAEKPPAQYLNWLANLVHQWVLYLKDAIFVADAGSGLAGVSGTGDTNQPGVSGTGNGTAAGVSCTGGATGPGAVLTPGGGSTPARGALAMAFQATPTSPAAGDLWNDNANGLYALRYAPEANTTTMVWISKYLSFAGLPGATASTTYYLAPTAFSTAAAATTSALGTTQHVATGRRVLSFGVRFSTTPVGGTVTAQVWATPPGGGAVQVGSSLTISGAPTNYLTSGPINVSITPGSIIELRIVNGAGVTTGAGQVVAVVEVL